MKLHKIKIVEGLTGWYWYGLARNGRIICTSGEEDGYARRGTAIRYMEAATDAVRRRIPVYAVNGNDVTTKLN